MSTPESVGRRTQCQVCKHNQRINVHISVLALEFRPLMLGQRERAHNYSLLATFHFKPHFSLLTSPLAVWGGVRLRHGLTLLCSSIEIKQLNKEGGGGQGTHVSRALGALLILVCTIGGRVPFGATLSCKMTTCLDCLEIASALEICVCVFVYQLLGCAHGAVRLASCHRQSIQSLSTPTRG